MSVVTGLGDTDAGQAGLDLAASDQLSAACSRTSDSLVDAEHVVRLSAARIRARLGAWASAAQTWKIWSAPDTHVSALSGPGNLVVRIDSPVTPAEQADWLAGGAAVLVVEGRFATLTVGGAVYRLAGNPDAQWLAAFAAFLDCACVPQDALCWAWGWRSASQAAHDWPTDLDCMPRVAGLPARAVEEVYAACPSALGLYPVVPDAQWVERLLDAGVKTIQLRIKNDDGSADPHFIEGEIHRAVAAGKAHQARVFINDHWQLALEAGAYGVHLGQEDLQVADLGAIARAGLRLGLSTHGVYEMLLAWHYRPSYLAFGAVFPTQTKQLASDPQGLARLARFVDLFAAHVSTVAIGGIDLAVLPQVLATGVGSAAVVRAVTGAHDLGAALTALEQVFAERAV